MKKTYHCGVVLCALLLVAACDDSDNNRQVESKPFELESFMPNTNVPGGLQVVNAFPGLSFHLPLDLEQIPGTNKLAVVEHTGRIHAFDNDPAASESSVFLDLTGRTDYGGESGLVNLVFDPDYERNGYFYVNYGAKRNYLGETRCSEPCSIISRFRRSTEDPLKADPDSEEIILTVPRGLFHHAHQLMFGADGYLYIGIGDSGESHDPFNRSQNRTDLRGSILRIDVSQGLPYRIPEDNPFVGETVERAGVVGEGEPVRHEIWAYGFRNPYRFSLDSVTGDIIVGDVGQNTLEELNLLTAGANYGWRVYEGTQVYIEEGNGRSPDEFTAPFFVYDRTAGSAVTAGHIYRGVKFPGLFGKYIYGDYIYGNIWALERDSNKEVVSNTLIANINNARSIASFAQINNETYFTNFIQGTIHTLEAAQQPSKTVPEKLSDTHVFASLNELQINDGFMPYAVNAPLWSDGAHKQRWFFLPEGEKIVFDAQNIWALPKGSVVVKQFSIDLDQMDDDNAPRKLETRILVNTEAGWIGYTYKWDNDQQDATLVTAGAFEELAINTPVGIEKQNYYFPSTADCLVCHRSSTGEGTVLGLRTQQLNREFAYDSGRANQLLTLDELDVFSQMIGSPEDYPDSYAGLNDSSASLEWRARSYLASNCAQCHDGGNTIPANFDLTLQAPGDDLDAINALSGDDSINDARIIKPGQKESSTLWLRMQATDSTRMPPLASHKVDEDAVRLIGEWIDSLPD